MKKDLIWILYKYFLFFQMLASFKAWFTWNLKFYHLFFLGYSIALFITRRYYFEIRQKNYAWFLILISAVIIGNISDGTSALINQLIYVLPLFYLISLKSEKKIEVLNTVRYLLSYLLGASIVGWISYFFAISLPYEMIEFGDYQGGAQYIFENHYLYLINVTRLETILFPRFCSVFLEPGYLGCLMAMLLFIGKYKFDKINIIFYIVLISTFSLAGYGLALIGYSICSFLKSKNRYVWLITTISAFGIVISSIFLYNRGNNYLNEIILSRLEYDEEKGIVGNNRSTYNTDVYFWNTFIRSENLLFGLGKSAQKKIHEADADWKVYVVQHGLLGTVFLILFMFYPCFNNRNKNEIAVLSMIYLLIFAQTIHLILSVMYLSVFILGVNSCKRLKCKQTL